MRRRRSLSQGSAVLRSTVLLSGRTPVRRVTCMTNTPRIALITGANRGLGRATALHLGRAGVGVVVAYRRNAEQADQVVTDIVDMGGCAVAVQLDTTDFGGFAALAHGLPAVLRDAFGRERLDVLVHNAGTGVY